MSAISSPPPPPSYDPSSSLAALPPEVLLLISPPASSVSFQVGRLGLGLEGEDDARIEGEVLVKGAQVGGWDALTVTLLAVESVQPSPPIELFRTTRMLWSSTHPHSSSPLPPSTLLPSSLPFSIPLTPDLPQDLVLPTSSLSYTVTATLHPSPHSSAPPPSVFAPVHLLRASPPPPLLPPPMAFPDPVAEDPHIWEVSFPTPVKVWVSKTLVARDEGLVVCASVASPSEGVVVDKGLRLRSVRAELWRDIIVHNMEAENALPALGKERVSDEVWETLPPDTFPPSPSSSSISPRLLVPPPTAHAPLTPPPDAALARTTTTLLSYSGKSCRFSSHRPVRIRLVLHPPPDDASITQSTILHDVRFRVRVTISMRGGAGEERDIVLEREVCVVPPPIERPPLPSSRSKEKERERPSPDPDLAVPPPPFSALPGPSTPAQPSASFATLSPVFEPEDEFDGYEDLADELPVMPEPVLELAESDGASSSAGRREEGETVPDYDGAGADDPGGLGMEIRQAAPGYDQSHDDAEVVQVDVVDSIAHPSQPPPPALDSSSPPPHHHHHHHETDDPPPPMPSPGPAAAAFGMAQLQFVDPPLFEDELHRRDASASAVAQSMRRGPSSSPVQSFPGQQELAPPQPPPPPPEHEGQGPPPYLNAAASSGPPAYADIDEPPPPPSPPMHSQGRRRLGEGWI